MLKKLRDKNLFTKTPNSYLPLGVFSLIVSNFCIPLQEYPTSGKRCFLGSFPIRDKNLFTKTPNSYLPLGVFSLIVSNFCIPLQEYPTSGKRCFLGSFPNKHEFHLHKHLSENVATQLKEYLLTSQSLPFHFL